MSIANVVKGNLARQCETCWMQKLPIHKAEHQIRWRGKQHVHEETTRRKPNCKIKDIRRKLGTHRWRGEVPSRELSRNCLKQNPGHGKTVWSLVSTTVWCTAPILYSHQRTHCNAWFQKRHSTCRRRAKHCITYRNTVSPTDSTSRAEGATWNIARHYPKRDTRMKAYCGD